MARSRALAYVVLIAALCLAGHAHADDRSDARAHYQAGVKFYGSGDYQGAIREFSAAQQLVPADLNNYNLALCYDKLGDAEPAIQYYRAFLDRQPNTDKRAEVEASIARLEAAQRSAAGKRVQAQAQSDDARRAEQARRADDAAAAPPPPPAATGGAVPAPGAPVPGLGSSSAPEPGAAPRDDRRRPGPAVAGSIGTPGSALPAPTGDPQLDRASAINIDEIRDQRTGVMGGPAERRAPGPAVAAADGASPSDAPQPAPGQPAVAPSAQPVRPEEPHEAPLYKKWWFWAVVGVSAYVAYELVTSSSDASSVRSRTQPQSALTTPPGGLTLLRW